MKAAAENLQRFHVEYARKLTDANIQPLMLMALTYLTLEELASKEANSFIQQNLDRLLKTSYVETQNCTLSRFANAFIQESKI
ncbi:DUF7005 family protein [Nostoc sp.]|uniref:DUF7005 family protein n=1 Tax=Nostoc sp. TaxID=1180 RepID=UPI002FFABB8A